MKKALLFLILTLSLPAFAFLGLPRLVPIKKIVCQTPKGACSQVIFEFLKTQENKNLHEARSEIKKYLKANERIVDFSVKFALLSNLEVYLIEREAFIALKGNFEDFALIDKEGVILTKTKSTHLPVLVLGENEYQIEETKVDENVITGAKILFEVAHLHGIKSGTLESESLRVNLMDREIFFPLDRDIDALLGSLGLILSQLNRPGQEPRIEKDIKVIDLRYKNPVLR